MKRNDKNWMKQFNTMIVKTIGYLNNSKLFAGVIMILLNVGSKFINIQFSKSTEEYMKMNVTKEILVFAMAWMGTRDVFAAICLTIFFIIFSDHILNEESSICLVPEQFRVLNKPKKTEQKDKISEEEISQAISVLEKAKKNLRSQK